MKRYSLLSFFPLVAFVFAVACSDPTAPANSSAALVSTGPLAFGDPPPPPVRAGIIITVNSPVALVGPFEGVYFSQGKTSWLQVNNGPANAFGTSASADARFKASGDRFSGHGTLMFGTYVVTIEDVTLFAANPDCGITGEPCATIEFDAKVNGESGHHGTALAFNRADCTFVPPGVETGGYFFCGGG
jgi:hypothetical protein